MYETYQHLKIGRRGRVLTVTLDNPPTNAVTRGMHAELATIFGDINRDDDTSVVIFTGAGGIFSSGGDIQAMAQRLESGDNSSWLLAMREAREILYGLLDLRKPIIARVNGHAIGMAASIAMFCDIIIAVDDAKIADTHVKIGLSAGDGGSLIWAQNIGFARAKEYLLTGNLLTGRQAAEMGLINYAVPRAELDAKVDGFAEQLAALPDPATSGTKQSINLVLRRQLEGLIEAHLGIETQTFMTPEHKESVYAFRDKRPAKYPGK